MNTKAYFCAVTGVRIAAPGVSIEVDPEHGQQFVDPPEPRPEPVANLKALEGQLAEAKRSAEAEKRRHAEELATLRAVHAREVEALQEHVTRPTPRHRAKGHDE